MEVLFVMIIERTRWNYFPNVHLSYGGYTSLKIKIQLVRSRLAVSQPGYYAGITDVVVKTVKEGGVRSLYRGLPAALAVVYFL